MRFASLALASQELYTEGCISGVSTTMACTSSSPRLLNCMQAVSRFSSQCFRPLQAASSSCQGAQQFSHQPQTLTSKCLYGFSINRQKPELRPSLVLQQQLAWQVGKADRVQHARQNCDGVIAAQHLRADMPVCVSAVEVHGALQNHQLSLLCSWAQMTQHCEHG